MWDLDYGLILKSIYFKESISNIILDFSENFIYATMGSLLIFFFPIIKLKYNI